MPKKTATETPEQKRYRETVQEIATNISALSRAVSSLLNGPLKRQALIVLLANSTRMSQSQVGDVLKALENLEKDWLR